MSDATLSHAPRRTAATNTPTTYGWVERTFHWSIALLIPTAAALGVVAYEWPYDTNEALATKATLFSAHKTVGLAVFFVALARIAWALTQARPRGLHPERRLESFAAATVHWLLYGSLVAVPLLGWAHHATAEGFAPIWWPFGQSLPLLPKDPDLSARLAVLHKVAVWVLGGSLALHVAGAVKHAVIDRDATLARMWRGTDPGPLPEEKGHALPVLAALGVWAAALGAGLILPPAGTAQVAAASEAAPAAPVEASGEIVPNWTVEEGTLEIAVTQMGQKVSGSFANWTAAIDFDEEPRADGTHGRVEVAVDTGSLTLGSVTSQAVGDEFLAASDFPTATFAADILPGEDGGYVADGTLELRGATVPVTLPFTLTLDGDSAVMEGVVPVDRRDFGIGDAYADETNVGFAVEIAVGLTAVRE